MENFETSYFIFFMSKVPLAKKNMFSNQIVYKRAQIVEILEIGYNNVLQVSCLWLNGIAMRQQKFITENLLKRFFT